MFKIVHAISKDDLCEQLSAAVKEGWLVEGQPQVILPPNYAVVNYIMLLRKPELEPLKEHADINSTTTSQPQ